MNYATHELVRDLAESLHHEARLEKILEILTNALESAFSEGYTEATYDTRLKSSLNTINEEI